MRDDRRGAVARQLRAIFDAGTAAGLSDGQLLERFATRRGEGAELAFAALVERHGPMVLRVCRRALGDEHAAQDAFQATFLVLARRSAAIRRADSVACWLHGVAVRVALGSRSAEARRRRHERACAGMRPEAVAAEARDDPGPALHEEVARLPERFRAPVVLCYLEGRSCDEAARLLACPVGTVKSRLAAARDRLRGRLVRRGLAPGTALLALAAEAPAASPTFLNDSIVRAATLLAAGRVATAGMVPVGVAALTEGALKAMLLSKLKLIAPALAVGLLAVGAGVFARQSESRRNGPGPEAALPVAANAATSARPDSPEANDPFGSPAAREPQSSGEADRLRDLDAKLDRILDALGADRGSRRRSGEDVAPADSNERGNPGRSGSSAAMRGRGSQPPGAAGPWPAPRSDAERIADLERRLDLVERQIQSINRRLGVHSSPGASIPPMPPRPAGPAAPSAAPAPLPAAPAAPPAPDVAPQPGANPPLPAAPPVSSPAPAPAPAPRVN